MKRFNEEVYTGLPKVNLSCFKSVFIHILIDGRPQFTKMSIYEPGKSQFTKISP